MRFAQNVENSPKNSSWQHDDGVPVEGFMNTECRNSGQIVFEFQKSSYSVDGRDPV